MYESFPDLFVKKGLFERKINLNNKHEQIDYDYDLRKLKNVVIKELPEQKINIVFTYLIDTVKTKKNTVELNVDLNQ